MNINVCVAMVFANQRASLEDISSEMRISVWNTFHLVYVIVVAFIILVLLSSLFIHALWSIYVDETTFESLKRQILKRNRRRILRNQESQGPINRIGAEIRKRPYTSEDTEANTVISEEEIDANLQMPLNQQLDNVWLDK